jgi:hypothetical protein
MDVVSLPGKRKTAKQVNGERYTVTREAKNCKARQEWSEKCYPRIEKLRSKVNEWIRKCYPKIAKIQSQSKTGE